MLSTAVRVGALNTMKEILATKVDVNEKDSVGMTALHRVFEPVFTTRLPPNRYAIFKELIAAGADVNAADKYGATPLMMCLWRIYGRSTGTEIVHDPRYTKRLLRAGADPNAQQYGESVFYMALKLGKYQEAAYILQAGANPLLGDAGGCDMIGDGIFVREELVDLILANTTDPVALASYKDAGKKVLEGLLLILDGRPSVSVFADNGWPRKNFIADYDASRIHALYARFC